MNDDDDDDDGIDCQLLQVAIVKAFHMARCVSSILVHPCCILD